MQTEMKNLEKITQGETISPVTMENIPNEKLQQALEDTLEGKNLVKVGTAKNLKKYLLED